MIKWILPLQPQPSYSAPAPAPAPAAPSYEEIKPAEQYQPPSSTAAPVSYQPESNNDEYGSPQAPVEGKNCILYFIFHIFY